MRFPGYAAPREGDDLRAPLRRARRDGHRRLRLASNDALVKRILTWAEAELGPPPAPYAWIVLGSEGRMEQTLLTDQDNALVFADEGTATAEVVPVAGRARQPGPAQAAGFPECPGGYMAQPLAGPLSEWKERFAAGSTCRSPTALLEASIFFDFRTRPRRARPVPARGGDRRRARARSPSSATWQHGALEFHPPPMLLLRLKGASSIVDLKRHGISPIVFLARATRSRSGAGRATRWSGSRRRPVRGDGQGPPGHHRGGLPLPGGLRLRLQLRQLQAGEAPANAVHLSDLSAIERSRLKDSLHAIHVWQGQAAHQFQTELLTRATSCGS